MRRWRKPVHIVLLVVLIGELVLLSQKERIRTWYVFRRALSGDENAVTALLYMGKGGRRYVSEVIRSEAPRDCRLSALLLLGLTPERSDEPFANVIDDKDAKIRGHAVLGLSAIASWNVRLVGKKLRDADRDVRLASVLACGDMARETFGLAGAVRELLVGDADGHVRAAAATVMGKMGMPGVVEALLSATQDPDPSVRAASARALGLLGAQDARGALKLLMNGPTDQEREAAVDAVKRLDEFARRVSE